MKLLLSQADKYINLIVQHMTTDLQEPDSVIIDQYDVGTAMYLIAKGEVYVVVGDNNENSSR